MNVLKIFFFLNEEFKWTFEYKCLMFIFLQAEEFFFWKFFIFLKTKTFLKKLIQNSSCKYLLGKLLSAALAMKLIKK